MTARALIIGCSGLALGAAERAEIAALDPWGFILFGRNIESADQIRALTADLREAVGRDAPVLIDQEGGRVARLRPPLARDWFPALEHCRRVSAPDRAEAMRLRYRLIAHELHALGIDSNCAPMLDLPQPDTHEIITDRCYGTDPVEVAAIGRAVADGLLEGGVLPVIKHVPGHGRATLDSHKALPVVTADLDTLRATDFAPFRALADLPMAMTAHITYPALDPDLCATLSTRAIAEIRGHIGFQGLLMSDDISMHALSGPYARRATGALEAGCDLILHCNFDRDAMDAAQAVPRLTAAAAARADAALGRRKPAAPFDPAAAQARLTELTGEMADV